MALLEIQYQEMLTYSVSHLKSLNWKFIDVLFIYLVHPTDVLKL